MRTGELETQLSLDAVMDRIEGDAWTLAARRCIARLPRGTEFTAETVRLVVGAPPVPNAIGALFHAMADQGVIVFRGYTKAARPEAHGRPIALWVRA